MLRRFPAGTRLYQQGDPADFVFVVVKGLVKLMLTSADGEETLLFVRGAGELVGLEPIGGLTRQASVYSVDDVVGSYISSGVVTRAVTEAPALCRDLVRELADTNAELAARLADYSTSARQRVARLLVRHGTAYGTSDNDGIRLPPLTQAELASAIGLSRRGMERALRELRDSGLVDLGYRQIIVRDLVELRRMAGVAAPETLAPARSSAGDPPALSDREPGTSRRKQPADELGAASRSREGAGSAIPHQVHVRLGAVSRTLSPGEEVTFGRSSRCELPVDTSDTGISRCAGVIRADNGTWFVVNTSVRHPLAVVDDIGFRSVLPPRRRCALQGRMRILLQGNAAKPHELTVEAPLAEHPSMEPMADEESAMAENAVLLTLSDRAVLLALFAGYLLEGEKYDPYPRTYAAAGARLGMEGTTVRKKVEHLRARLHAAGVPNMNGPAALTNLAEYVLVRRLITKDDLRSL
ncbi:helix-turn-helix domain-containing protein [Lentzea sp. NPDC005914]|uniref:helix-turn-helix domain-containing protein n=1 Tax=Lentzea sp. NPDC005914 TaxID=3154572 RepID=UPI0033EBAAB5